MENIKSEEYVICPRCKQEVYKEAIICSFCKFSIMAWLEGEIDENGEPIKNKSKQNPKLQSRKLVFMRLSKNFDAHYK